MLPWLCQGFFWIAQRQTQETHTNSGGHRNRGHPSVAVSPQERSVVTQVRHGAVVQAALMGVALGPGDVLAVNIGALALVRLGMTLSNHGLMTALLKLASPHPLHIGRLSVGGIHG